MRFLYQIVSFFVIVAFVAAVAPFMPFLRGADPDIYP